MLVRVAEAMGWTHGQVWTVCLGLLLAMPAAIFGLGPALEDVISPATAPARIGSGGSASARLVPQPTAGTASTPLPRPAQGTGAAPNPAFVDTLPSDGAAIGVASGTTISGEGRVTALAARGARLFATVDRGAETAGSVVVVDDDRIRAQYELAVDGVTYAKPSGIATTGRSLIVATQAPAALLELSTADGSIVRVIPIPDVGVCLPLVAPANCQPAIPDTPPKPRHVTVDDHGTVYVADPGQGCIERLAAGNSKVTTWLCDTAFVGAPAAESGGIDGIEAASGRLLASLADAGLQGDDRVIEIDVKDGQPSGRRDLATGVGGTRPGGIIVLPDGRTVVALSAANAVFVVQPDGASGETRALEGLVGPVDLATAGGSIVIAHAGGGGAGQLTRYPVETL